VVDRSPSALFSFDRDRERQMAEHFSKGRPEWLNARYTLIDQVISYRETGILAQSLLDACDAEFKVARFAYSVGVRRLCELSEDGHREAIERIASMKASSDWRVRYEAIRSSFAYTKDGKRKREVFLVGLRDKSAGIRTRMALEACFSHMIEMADEIERAALLEKRLENAREMFFACYDLRRNESTGRRGRMGGGTEADASARELACVEFLARRARSGEVS